MLEFGDFEQPCSFSTSEKCVELPSSWELHSCQQFLSANASKQENHIKSHVKTNNVSSSVNTESIVSPSSKTASDDDLKFLALNKQAENNDKGVISFGQKSEQPEINENISKQVEPKEEINGKLSVPLSCSPSDENHLPDKIEDTSVKNNNIEEKSPTAPMRGWANLFRNKSSEMPSLTNQTVVNGSNHSLEESNKIKKSNFSTSKTPATSTESSTTTEKVSPSNDPNARSLASALADLELKFKPQAFIPRGLINSSNWCYINATLQALLMCPPFFQLLKSLPRAEKNQKTSTPFIDCFINLACEFSPLSTKKGYQQSKEIRQGPPFTPDCVYEMLASTKSSLSENGTQEDAEEFLSCVLNGLHEEMCCLDQLIHSENEEAAKVKEDKSSIDNSQNSLNDQEEEEEWEEVIGSKRNKTAVTRRADRSKTILSQIFRGELCTSVTRSGQKLSMSHEPFYALPLTFPQHEQYWSVEDALYALTDRESFSGIETNQNVTRQQFIEILPPILILHLKRFVYNKNGGLKKIDRRMDFRSDLIIAKDLLSKSAKKYSSAQRTYKLFAVVCHHGERATGGHYTADVFHIGMSSWLRIDDQKIQTVSHNEVTRHSPTRSPYLLFYRRIDLG